MTTNLLNGKIYVGKHKCRSLLDGYLGSGKLIKKSIAKYGKESFRRTVLAVFSSEFLANEYEAKIVTEEFCKSDGTYNLCDGGRGGFEHINRSGIKKFHGHTHTSEAKEIIRIKATGRPSSTRGKALTDEHKQKISDAGSGRKLSPRSEEHRRRISESLKDGYQSGRIKRAPGSGFQSGHRRTGPLSDTTKAKIAEKTRLSWSSGNRRRIFYDWPAIQADINNGLSPKEIRIRNNITKNVYDHGIKKGYLKR